MRTQFKSILVPLDGSAFAEQALPLGVSLARRAGAALHLVSVQEPVPAVANVEIKQYGVEFDLESRAELSRYLTDVQHATRADLAGDVRGEVIEGHVPEALAEYVAGHGIGLVVMTTHGRGGIARWWHGSVADRLLRRLSIPVLLLHPGDLPQPVRFRRILVALDGEIEEPVLAAAIALGSFEADTEYILVRVAEPPSPLVTPLALSPSHLGPLHTQRDAEETAHEYLDEVTGRLRAQGLTATSRVVRTRHVSDQLVELARETDADCIALGTHGATGLERLLTGSMADEIVRGTKLPVLVGPVGHR